MTAERTFVMEASELTEGEMRRADAGTGPLLLARVEGKVYAMVDTCAHMRCSLSRGKLEGHIVTCPCHDWRYDVRTGEFLDAPEIRLRTYACTVEENRIMVELEGRGQWK